MLQRKSAGSTLAIAGWDYFPSAEEWRAWGSLGVRYVESVGHRLWLVELEGDAGEAFEATDATTLAALNALDKVAVGLERPEKSDGFFNAKRRLVVVDVTLMDGTDEAERQLLRKAFHVEGVEHVDRSAGGLLTMVMDPGKIEAMADRSSVLRVEPGAWRTRKLMDSVRVSVNSDPTIGLGGIELSGAGILAATRERLAEGADHDAFWNHDASGNKTTPRWTALAESFCVHGIDPDFHGMMTAGVLLGNGWFSDRFIDDVDGFRGIAPSATLECYGNTGAKAHLSSHSYHWTDNFWNQAVLGELGDARHHAHVAAAGNYGIKPYDGEVGYYSVVNGSKNVMIVGNAQPSGPINPESSAGPTHDGRLKPDITAPTSDYGAYESEDFSLQVARIGIRRGATQIVDWVFNAGGAAWHLGWGQPAGNFGEVFLEIAPTVGGNMRIDVESEPWGENWSHTPILGTATLPSSDPAAPGAPLNIQGHEDDVMVIEYRALPTAQDLGYFQLSPTWMRCYPHGSTGCSGDTFWYSQSTFDAVAIGDGNWHTLELPIGLATGSLSGGNARWDDEQTWAGESIQWLGFRFKRTEISPTPSFPRGYSRASAGTSGASPVVGGAYALAMEHLADLYPDVDLDAKHELSPYYFEPGAQPNRGMPFNSTWKALFIHTAEDMVRLSAPADVPVNPDTGVANVYHRGPDYTTGYGLIDIQAGIDLMTDVANDVSNHRLIEYELKAGEFHQYTFEIFSGDVGRSGFAATLAWDDATNSSGTLVNNLALVMVGPDGGVHFPWSLEPPPEPMTAADIVPARRDQHNHRDNVEQVMIDVMEEGHVGTWTAYVVEFGIGAASGKQRYSLVMSPIAADPPPVD